MLGAPAAKAAVTTAADFRIVRRDGPPALARRDCWFIDSPPCKGRAANCTSSSRPGKGYLFREGTIAAAAEFRPYEATAARTTGQRRACRRLLRRRQGRLV